jgi:hypothetical protein
VGFSSQEGAEKEKITQDKRSFWVGFGLAFAEVIYKGQVVSAG